MRNIWLIAKRDLSAMFKKSIVAYIALLVFYEISAYFFVAYVTYTKRMDLSGYFGNMYVILIFLLPIITASAFSQEIKNNTLELLYTSPISDVEIYLGKLTGHLIFFFFMILPTFFYIIFCFIYGNPSFGKILTSLIGYIMLGISFITVGLFFAALIKNQFVAGLVSAIFLLLLYVLDWTSSTVTSFKLRTILNDLSLINHLRNTFNGLLDLNDMFYFIVFILFFSITTINILDVKK